MKAKERVRRLGQVNMLSNRNGGFYERNIRFTNRGDFRKWLSENCQSDAGVWLLFGKAGGPKTIKAKEALEEALCFGWIDGQMQSLDDKTYKKYFSQRRENSKWSEKNKGIVKQLEQQGIMTDYGRSKIEEAKKNGQWDAPKGSDDYRGTNCLSGCYLKRF